MPAMKPEIKALWIEALESGDYKQGTGALKRTRVNGDTQYCCLGVLCDLAVKAGIVTDETGDHTFNTVKTVYISTDSEQDRGSALLPLSVMRWASLMTDNAAYGFNGNQNLVYQNDDGASFTEIAEIIEDKF